MVEVDTLLDLYGLTFDYSRLLVANLSSSLSLKKQYRTLFSKALSLLEEAEVTGTLVSDIEQFVVLAKSMSRKTIPMLNFLKADDVIDRLSSLVEKEHTHQ
ncbi:MAG: hypothetical protein QXV55_04155 [Acidilobaceae archaeon]